MISAERDGFGLPTQWPDDVVIGVEAKNRRSAVEMAASLLSNQHGLPKSLVFRALWRRELAGSTALGHGVAIPHARIPGINRPLTLFLRLQHKIDFGAGDHEPVNGILAFLVPEQGAQQEHLKLLGVIAKLFSEPAFCSRLHTMTKPAEIRRLFAECCASHIEATSSCR